jgi:hypothetical protein
LSIIGFRLVNVFAVLSACGVCGEISFCLFYSQYGLVQFLKIAKQLFGSPGQNSNVKAKKKKREDWKA